MKKFALSVCVVLLVPVIVTYIALEASGVITVETRTPEGQTRSTHVWFVEVDGQYLLEAGSPTNPWVRDLQQVEVLSINGEGLDGNYAFEQLGQDSHMMIRSKMREKYGWRDAWISLIFDTTQSYAVRIERLN